MGGGGGVELPPSAPSVADPMTPFTFHRPMRKPPIPESVGCVPLHNLS